MRKSTLALTLFALLIALPTFALAANEPATITVHGQAEVRVTPDQVVITLGIQTFDEQLSAAKERNDEVMSALLAVARDQGIDEEDVATDYLSIEPRVRDHLDVPELVGYQVRRTIVVTLKDTERFEGFLSSALEAGVNYVHGVDFRTTELRKYRDQARDKAMIAAREKAEAMAGSLDRKIGKPLSIQEGQAGWWSPYSSWGGRFRGMTMQNVSISAPDGGASWTGPTPPGQISVTARVTVTFELED